MLPWKCHIHNNYTYSIYSFFFFSYTYTFFYLIVSAIEIFAPIRTFFIIIIIIIIIKGQSGHIMELCDECNNCTMFQFYI